MRILASPIAVVCAVAAAGAASTVGVSAATTQWPEHGVVKISSPKSPSEISIDLKDCCNVSLDWKGNRIVAKGAGGEEAVTTGGAPMKPGGGKFVALLMLEEKKMNMVVNVEVEGGELQSKTIRLPTSSCPLTKLTISSSNGDVQEDLEDVHVSVSEEIDQLLRNGREAVAA